MRSHSVLLACLVLLSPAFRAKSAEIVPVKSADCRLKLDGVIAAGDGAKLTAALDALPAVPGREGDSVSICLNSLGGNYDEALELITIILKRTNIATVIDRGAQCFSACAFLFLAGNTQRSEDGELGPDRTLDVSATLGFHAPYLKAGAGADVVEASIENFRRGVTAIARLLEIDRRDLYPRGLLARALQVSPDYLLYVDTIEKAGIWSIKLKGYKPPAALTSRMLDQACRNKDMWSNFSHTVLARPADDPEELHGYRQSDFPEIRGTDEPIALSNGKYRTTLDLFGYEATNVCIVDVFADEGKRLFLSLSMVPADQEVPKSSDFADQVTARLQDPQSLEVISAPLWYVFSPDTTLKSIALP